MFANVPVGRGRLLCGTILIMITLTARRWVRLAATSLLFLAVLAVSPPVRAEDYGDGAYGRCTYGSCDQASPTVITLPSGLEIAINLTDGQVITGTSYAVTVTPLNGAGATF